jgi:hypothetical protein
VKVESLSFTSKTIKIMSISEMEKKKVDKNFFKIYLSNFVKNIL